MRKLTQLQYEVIFLYSKGLTFREIDTLLANKPRFIQPNIWNELVLKDRNYFMMTLHRPANVDDPTRLRAWMNAVSSWLSASGQQALFFTTQGVRLGPKH